MPILASTQPGAAKIHAGIPARPEGESAMNLSDQLLVLSEFASDVMRGKNRIVATCQSGGVPQGQFKYQSAELLRRMGFRTYFGGCHRFQHDGTAAPKFKIADEVERIGLTQAGLATVALIWSQGAHCVSNWAADLADVMESVDGKVIVVVELDSTRCVGLPRATQVVVPDGNIQEDSSARPFSIDPRDPSAVTQESQNARLERGSLAFLPPDSRRLLEVLTVIGKGATLRVMQSLAGIEIDDLALKAVYSHRIVKVAETPYGPWMTLSAEARKYIYAAMPPTRRRELHRIASDACTGLDSLGHKFAATHGLNDELAAEIVEQIHISLDSGDVATAAKAALWSSDLSTVASTRQNRLLWASALMLWSEQTAEFENIRPRLSSAGEDPVYTMLLASQGIWRGEFGGKADLLRISRDHEGVAKKEWISGMAAYWHGFICLLQERPGDARKVALRALAANSSLDKFIADRLHHLSHMAEWWVSGGVHRGDRDVESPNPVQYSPVVRGMQRISSLDLSDGLRDLNKGLALARFSGQRAFDEAARFYIAYAKIRQGLWEEGSIVAHTTLSTFEGRVSHWSASIGYALKCGLHSLKGEWDKAEESLAHARQGRGMGAAFFVRLAEATLSQAQADYPRMLDALDDISSSAKSPGAAAAHRAWWEPLHVEALIACGHASRAQAALGSLNRLARRTPALRATEAWLAAWLTAEAGDAEEATLAFSRALEMSEQAECSPMCRARIQQEYGRFLISLRNRGDAARYLNSALSFYSAVGAAPYQERCNEDLLAGGVTEASKISGLQVLTPRETSVARLVGKGLTNQEIAQNLRVSAKTVEYHLTNIFGKLGMSSRRELRALVQSGDGVE
ncbi:MULTISPECIES: LuxR family transcriptional regulator [Streptomyces]|uniref:LuxR family transcriptional regulator n=1 Tax=Streptomyces TaxID=1883 RepID=UPI00131E05FD|nr:LuxR family transcriptional regulator [Streptomyces virginiae]